MIDKGNGFQFLADRSGIESFSLSSQNNHDLVAIVDIGSNSVRLVVYDFSRGAPQLLMKAGDKPALGKGTCVGHRALNPEGQVQALEILRGFRESIKKYQDQGRTVEVFAMGTAALRSVHRTQAGQAFLKEANQSLGWQIRIISGRMEAHLTGLGVRYVHPNLTSARFVGIGGGSIEGGSIDDQGKITGTFISNWGALSLHEAERQLGGKPMTQFKAAFKPKTYREDKSLYLAGGNFRAYARILYAYRKGREVSNKFPHGFSLSVRPARSLLYKMSHLPVSMLREMPSSIATRADHLKIGARALAHIIKVMRASRVYFSQASIREGLLQAIIQGEDLRRLQSAEIYLPHSKSMGLKVVKSRCRDDRSHNYPSTIFEELRA